MEIRQFGLIGKSLKHSFSPQYFFNKFKKENIRNASYELYELPTIQDFKLLISSKNFCGLNVTIPYKESIIPYLDDLSTTATQIGAVNTIQFLNNKLIGHNTDVIGAEKSILKLITRETIEKALILGTGGASKSIQFALKSMDIPFHTVSRSQGHYLYEELDKDIIESHRLIINTTPLGTFPDINHAPNIPYQYLSSKHLLFDLVYNPKITLFLKHGLSRSCKVINGYYMLEQQAEAAWNIWASK